MSLISSVPLDFISFILLMLGITNGCLILEMPQLRQNGKIVNFSNSFPGLLSILVEPEQMTHLMLNFILIIKRSELVIIVVLL